MNYAKELRKPKGRLLFTTSAISVTQTLFGTEVKEQWKLQEWEQKHLSSSQSLRFLLIGKVLWFTWNHASPLPSLVVLKVIISLLWRLYGAQWIRSILIYLFSFTLFCFCGSATSSHLGYHLSHCFGISWVCNESIRLSLFCIVLNN